ncbi:1,4-beta-D-xylan synthase [Bertholletia excelsa]
MSLADRPKKKVKLYKKAIVHFLLCFFMGFFTGLAPTGKSSIFSSSEVATNRSALSPAPTEELHQPPVAVPVSSAKLEGEEQLELKKKEEELVPRRLLIVVTATRAKDQLRGARLTRLASTLRMAPPPVVWVVVEQQMKGSGVAEVLRRTGVMYRHLVFKENFTDAEVEMEHQMNLALKHIEHHRLSGIVHFAGLENVYDLSFFDEIRAVEAFGTWPIAKVYTNRRKVVIEGPVCDSSEVVGWHLRSEKTSNQTEGLTLRSSVHISSFAFNSSILWDPERWGRPSSSQSTSQDAVKFVKKEVVKEETKLTGIPAKGCSKILLWNVHVPAAKASNNWIRAAPPDRQT